VLVRSFSVVFRRKYRGIVQSDAFLARDILTLGVGLSNISAVFREKLHYIFRLGTMWLCTNSWNLSTTIDNLRNPPQLIILLI
jgi:hypothetical protein